MIDKSLPADIRRAMWEGDTDYLNEHYGCVCCCHEHTFTTGCPAYAWGGCRGQTAQTREDIEAWANHYRTHHGLTRDQFFGGESDTPGVST